MTSISDVRGLPRNTLLCMYLVIGLVSVALTIPSVFYAFVQDDHLLVVENPTITSWRHLGEILTKDYFHREGFQGQIGYYRPLTRLSFLIDHTIWGLSPVGFHITNVLLGIMGALLALRVATLLLPPQFALLAGALYACHPVRAQALGIVTARSDLIAAVFAFAAAQIWLAYGSKGHPRLALPILLLFSMLGKESALTLPLVLGLWSIARVSGSPRPRSPCTWIALAAPVIAYASIRVGCGVVVSLARSAQGAAILPGAGRILWYYLGELLVPISGAAAPQIPWPGTAWVLLLFVPLAALTFSVFARGADAVRVGASWVFLTLAPLLAPQAIGNPTIPGFLAPSPRFLYLPALGVAVLWAGLLERVARTRFGTRPALLVGVLGALILGGEFLSRIAALRNDDAIAEAVLRDLERLPEDKQSPAYRVKVLATRAQICQSREEFEKAREATEQALALQPSSLNLRVSLGWLLQHEGRDSAAIALLRETLDPARVGRWDMDDFQRSYGDGVSLLGSLLMESGEYQEALWWGHLLTATFPRSWKAHAAFGDLLRAAGDSAAAEAAFATARALASSGGSADKEEPQ